MSEIKVSVIIPVYNAEKYLKECLESVLNQTLKEIEIICIDDGSTDNSLEILNEYKNKDERVIVLRQVNSGSGIARNLGIKHSSGEYIAFMDADDYYPSNKVLKILFDGCRNNNVLIAGGGISLRKNNELIPANKRGESNYFNEEGIIKYNDVQFDYGYQRYIFSHNLLTTYDILFPPYIRFQDPPFLVKAMICAQKFYAIREETYCYRWGHQNINWNFKRTNDMVCGIIDVLNLSIENNLVNLFKVSINRIDKEYYKIINNSLKKGNRDLFMLLIRYSSIVNENRKLLKSNTPLFCENYIAASLLDIFDNLLLLTKSNDNKETLRVLQNELENIKLSKSYRLGRILTFIPRKVKGGLKCYKEHGVKYTLNRVLIHLRLKK